MTIHLMLDGKEVASFEREGTEYIGKVSFGKEFAVTSVEAVDDGTIFHLMYSADRSPVLNAAEIALLRSSQKIHAIKMVRERCHISLKDAKDLVETHPDCPRAGQLHTIEKRLVEQGDECGAMTSFIRRTGASSVEAKHLVDAHMVEYERGKNQPYERW